MSEATVHNVKGTVVGHTADLDGASMPSANRVKDLKPHQQELLEMYQKARQVESCLPFPNPDTVRGDLVGSGRLQRSFLLPNGTEQLKDTASIGLFECINPKLHEMRYSAQDKGYWLRFTGETADGETKESWVLVYEGRSGKGAIKSFRPHQKELLDLYREARQVEGSLPFPNPDTVRGDLVGPRGKLQK